MTTHRSAPARPSSLPSRATLDDLLQDPHLQMHLTALHLGWGLAHLRGASTGPARPFARHLHLHGQVMTGTRAGQPVSVLTVPSTQHTGCLIFESGDGEIWQWVRQHRQLCPIGPIRRWNELEFSEAAVHDPAGVGLRPIPGPWNGRSLQAGWMALRWQRWALSVLLGSAFASLACLTLTPTGTAMFGFSMPLGWTLTISMLLATGFARLVMRFVSTTEYRTEVQFSGGPLRVWHLWQLHRSLNTLHLA